MPNPSYSGPVKASYGSLTLQPFTTDAAEYNALRVFLSRPGLAPELRHRLAIELTSRMCDRLQLHANAPERMWPAELLLERLYLQLDQRLR